MKNKLINIKNILRIIISVIVIFSMVKSCAKAVTYDDIKNYVDATAEMYPNNSKYQWIKDRITNTYFINGLYTMPIGDYDNFNIKYSQKPTRVELSIWLYNATEWVTSSSGITFKGQYITATLDGNAFYKSSGAYTNTGSTQINEGQFYSTTANNYNNLYGMNYTKDYIEETYPVPVTYVGNQAADPPYTYYLGSLHTKEITYNGETVLANTLNYNYRISWVANVVCEDTIITSMQAYLNDYELECYDLGTYWNLEYPNSTMFKYNQLYNLRVDSIIEGNIKTLEAKILFVPPGTTISGGEITSIPSGDYSFNTENATNQIIDNINNLNNNIESGNKEVINNINDSSEVESIMNETFSGDIEIISSDLGFSALDNPFTSFLFFVIDGVYDVMTEREDLTLNTHYKSIQFNLASTDFITPQSELKTFIRNMLICVYIYGNYKWFHYMITLLETARINKFMAEIGTDEFYDTDIM